MPRSRVRRFLEVFTTATCELFGGQATELVKAESSALLQARDSLFVAQWMAHFRSAYASDAISKEDLFYYTYGLLHSPEYRERYADNLSKELPRIPRMKSAADFWAFSKAGRALADLHLNYETVEKYPLTVETKGPLTDADYRVEKMKFAKRKHPETGKNVDDRSSVNLALGHGRIQPQTRRNR